MSVFVLNLMVWAAIFLAFGIMFAIRFFRHKKLKQLHFRNRDQTERWTHDLELSMRHLAEIFQRSDDLPKIFSQKDLEFLARCDLSDLIRKLGVINTFLQGTGAWQRAQTIYAELESLRRELADAVHTIARLHAGLALNERARQTNLLLLRARHDERSTVKHYVRRFSTPSPFDDLTRLRR